MAAVTQHLAHSALAGRRYGSFADKPPTLASGRTLTQHRPHGVFSGRRYGSFADKPSSGVSADPLQLVHEFRIPPSWFADIGFQAAYAFDPTLGIQGANRDNVASGAHPVGRLTQYRPHGAIAGRRFGAFAGRGALPGTTGAVMYVRPRLVAAPSIGGTTGAVMYVPYRALTALWTSSGVISDQAEQAWLPPQRQPMTYTQNGQQYCDPAWYRALQYLFEVRVGGRAGPSIPEVVTAVTTVQSTAAAASAVVAEVQQQTQANAEALFVVREVVQGEALGGSEQIPTVDMR